MDLTDPPQDPHDGPIHVPEEWHDHDLLTFEQFCALIHTPPRTVRDWRRRATGPRWTKLDGTGRLYITIAEVRRFTHTTATSKRRTDRNDRIESEETPS